MHPDVGVGVSSGVVQALHSSSEDVGVRGQADDVVQVGGVQHEARVEGSVAHLRQGIVEDGLLEALEVCRPDTVRPVHHEHQVKLVPQSRLLKRRGDHQ